MNIHYYAILGLDLKASEEEIRKAYYGIIKDRHEDRYHNAPSYFKEGVKDVTEILNEAYGILSDSTERTRYDKDLEHGNAKKWHTFEKESLSMEKKIQEMQVKVTQAQRQKEEVENELRDEREKSRKEKEENERKLQESEKKRRKMQMLFYTSVTIIIVACFAFFYSLNRTPEDLGIVPVSLNDTVEIEGLYTVTFTSDGLATTETAELTKKGDNDYALTIYSDGPILSSCCHIVSDGVIHSSIWGDGTIMFTPSQNKVTICFTTDNNVICEFVK